jgi:hypothetical protein
MQRNKIRGENAGEYDQFIRLAFIRPALISHLSSLINVGGAGL